MSLLPYGVEYLLVLLCVFLLVKNLSRDASGPIRDLLRPRDGKSWLWGHQFAIFNHEDGAMCLKWVTELGSVFRIKAALFQPDIVVVADNTAAQYIFQNAYTYVKAPAFRPLVQKLLGRGIVWAEGDEHKHQRRLLAPAFSPSAIEGMSEDVFACSEKMTARLRADIVSQGSRGIVNIAPYISACTLDIIGRVGFGYDFGGGQSREAQDIFDSWHQDVVLAHTFGGFFAPILLNIMPWITKLPIPALQTDSVAKAITIRLASEMIEENRAGNGRDILSLLTAGQKKNQFSMSKDTLLANISTLLMVGHETTAATINFTLLHLSKHPKIQARLREELRQCNMTDTKDIMELPFLDAVVREGLRLHPASPRTERVTTQDDVIPLGKPVLTKDGKTITSLPVKAGQIFHISFTTMNTNPEVWGPDASEFNPDRWLIPGALPPTSELPHGPWSNVASFCDGARGCIGWRLAVMEMKVMIGSLLRTLEMKETGHKIECFVSPTLQPFVNGEGGIMPMQVSVSSDL